MWLVDRWLSWKPARVKLLRNVTISKELEESLLSVGGDEVLNKFVVNVNREEDYSDYEIDRLERAFIWIDSREGHEFWKKVCCGWTTSL